MNFKFLLPLVVSLFLIDSTFAMFADSAQSTNNTFSAAAVFPTPTPTSTISPSISPSPTPTNIANHIVISEVQIAGAGPNDDFIELYNPTSSDIDISNFRLAKRTSSGTTDTDIKVFGVSDKILAHKFYLWCNTGLNVTLSCDANSTDTLSNDNSIAVRQDPTNSGTIIDAVTIGSPTHPLGEGTNISSAPTANQSIERKAYSTSTASTMIGLDSTKGNGFDTDDNATDFTLRSTSEPQNSSNSPETP